MLTQALKGSLLIRPWVRMADASGRQITGWLGGSRLVRALSGSVRMLAPFRVSTDSRVFRGYQAGLITGAALLLGLLTVAETGLIGAATWALLAYVLLGWLLFQPKIAHRVTVIDLLVLLFFASAALSAAFSSYVMPSFIGLAKFLTFLAGYAVFRTVSEQGAKPVIALVALIALLGLGESLIGFYQHANHIQPLATWTDPETNPELTMNRIFGTLKPYNPNLLAGFLTPCFAMAAGLGLYFLDRRKTWPLAALFLMSCPALLLALVWTGSRGAYLAIGAMLVFLFAAVGHLIWHDAQWKRNRWLKPAWLVILIGSVLLIGAGIASNEKIQHRVASIFAMREDSSISYRLNVYDSAARMFRDNPIAGIGPGNNTFKLVYGLYIVPGYNALGAYSVPLEIAVEQGVIGLLIFLSLLFVLKLRTGFVLDSARPLPEKLLVMLLFAGIAGSFAYGFFDTIWYRPSVNLPFWLMVAFLARLSEPEPADARAD